MTFSHWQLFFAGCFSLLLALLAVPASAQQSVITIDHALESIDLTSAAYKLEDPDGRLRFAEVKARNEQFKQASTSTGLSPSAFWWRFQLRNTSNQPQTVWFDTGSKLLHDADLYVIDAAGAIEHQATGAMQKFGERPLPTRTFVFPVSLPADQTVELYLRVRSYGLYSSAITPQIWQPQAYASEAKSSTARWFAYVGLAAGLIVFNLFLYAFTRDLNFLLYVLTQISIVWVVSTTAGGFGSVYEYVWPNSPLLEQAGWNVFAIPAFFLINLFLLRFMSLSTLMPRLYRGLWLLAALAMSFVFSRVMAALLQITDAGHIVHQLGVANNVFAILWELGFLGVTLYLAFSGQRAAKMLAIAWTPMMLGALIGNVSALLGKPVGPVSMSVGSALELILMSLALADRFNQEMISRERLGRLRRFFSPAVADKLLSDGSEDFLKPRRREIVVVFIDLRGYTAFTDTHTADDVMQMLGEFHEAMGEIIMAHGGTLERFAGDGLMIFFNDPIEIADPAQQAIAMATAMQQRFTELNTQWQQRGYTLAMGIGIAQGVATLGAIGFEGRRDYGAIGGVTNLAARLCGEAKGGQILLSESAARNIATSSLQSVSPLLLKGFAQTQAAFAVIQGAQA